MSIGPFDPTAGDYGSLNYVDPFGDTTADIGKSVAPAEPKTIMPVPQRPVGEKSTVPAKVSGGNVGISPITMQGAVSIPAEPSSPNQAYLDAMAQKDAIAQSISAISPLVFPQPYVDPRTPEEQEAALSAFKYNNDYRNIQVSPELESMTGSELEALYRQQGSSNTIVDGIDWGFGAGPAYKTADTGYSPAELSIAWNKKMIEEGRLQPKTDRTGQYTAIPSTKLPSEGFGGLQGRSLGVAPVFLLNSENPEEGGIEAARAELLDYIDNNPLGDGDVAGYDYNLNIVSNAIGGKYGVLGTDWDKTSDILPQGGNTDTKIQRVVDAFDGVSSAAEGIKNYTGKEDYTPAEYTGGLFNKSNNYTNMSDAKFNEFYSLIKPIADDYLFATAVSGNGLTQAREKFLNDPMIASLMNEYGMKQTRSTKDGSLYTWDPFTNREIRLKEEKYSLGRDVVQGLLTVGTIAVTAGNPVAAAAVSGARAAQQGGDLGDVAKASIGAYLGSQAAGGQGMFSSVGNAVAPANSALAKGVSAATASGVATAVQGGDLDNIVQSGVLAGLGGYVQGLGAEAAQLEQAAQAAGAAGDFSSSIALTMQANDMTQQLGMMNKIVNSASAIDAIANENYAGALAFGLKAADIDVQDWTEKKLTSTLGNDVFNTLDLEATAKAVNKIGMDVVGGDDFDKALESGLVGYVKDTGLDDAAKDYAKTALASAAKGFYEGVLKPVGDSVAGLFDKVSEYDTPEGIKAIEDAVRVAGNAVDDKVLQPIKEGAESVYEPLSGPDINLPSVDMSGMFDSLMSYLPSQRTQPAVQQQTTDPVLADLSHLYMEPTAPEELLASKDYLSGLLRTI
jgi:hypothetical protein